MSISTRLKRLESKISHEYTNGISIVRKLSDEEGLCESHPQVYTKDYQKSKEKHFTGTKDEVLSATHAFFDKYVPLKYHSNVTIISLLWD